MTLEELRAQVDAGEIDTVLLALTDMQGRLQGKRLTARHFLDEVAEHGAEGCNYLLAVDVEMNTGRGLRDGLVGARLRRLRDAARPRHAAAGAVAGGHRAVPRRPRLGTTAPTSSPRRARSCARQLARLAERGWTRERRHRARVPRLPRHLRAGAGARATASSSRPTSTTSTTRCSAPRASSR